MTPPLPAAELRAQWAATVAKVLEEHSTFYYGDFECNCGEHFASKPLDRAHVAAEAVAALLDGAEAYWEQSAYPREQRVVVRGPWQAVPDAD